MVKPTVEAYYLKGQGGKAPEYKKPGRGNGGGRFRGHRERVELENWVYFLCEGWLEGYGLRFMGYRPTEEDIARYMGGHPGMVRVSNARVRARVRKGLVKDPFVERVLWVSDASGPQP